MYHASIKSVGVVVLVVLLLTSAVEAGMVLRLSDLSSDETSPDALDATLTFDVLGDGLTLLVANDTESEEAFNISEVYFNAVHSTTELLFSPPVSGWDLLRDQRADGFGTFDFALIGNSGNDPARIGPGESWLFVFEVAGIEPATASDFTSDFSEIPPGEHQVIAAVKFVNGPGDDSAYGAVIPEPATVVLLLIGCGLAISTTRRRKRHAVPRSTRTRTSR